MAVHFDGTGSNYLTSTAKAPPLAKAANWTICRWVRVNADNGGYQAIDGLNKSANVGSYGDYFLRLRGSGTYGPQVGEWEWNISDVVNSHHPFDTGQYGADGQYRLVATVNDGSGSVTFYTSLQNTAVIAESSFTLAHDLTSGTGTNNGLVSLGLSDAVTAQSDCDIAEWFIVPNSLTVAELQELAGPTGGGSAKTIDQLGYTPTVWYKLAAATDLTDYGTAGNDLTATGTPTTVSGPSVLPTATQAVNVDLGVGTLSLVGHATTVVAGANSDMGVMSLSRSIYSPDVHAGKVIAIGQSQLSRSGYSPTVKAGVSIDLEPGSMTLQSLAAKLSLGASVTMGVRSLSVSSYAPAIAVGNNVPLSVTIGAGHKTLTGHIPTPRAGQSLTILPDAKTLTARQQAAKAGALLEMGAETLTLSGLNGDTQHGQSLQIGRQQFTLTTYSPEQANTVNITMGYSQLRITSYAPNVLMVTARISPDRIIKIPFESRSLSVAAENRTSKVN